MGGKFSGNVQTREGMQRAKRITDFSERQAAGLPVLTEGQQQDVAKDGKKEGFFSPFKGGVDPTIKKNKVDKLTAIPQYDTSANSAYRQQMSLRKVRANKL